MKISFTEKNIKSLKKEEKPYEVVDINKTGLMVRIQPSGLKTFYLRYTTIEGEGKRCKLGQYGMITLSQAKEKAKIENANVAMGKYPHIEKLAKRQKAQIEKSKTLRYYISEHYKQWALKNQKRGDVTLEIINRKFSAFLDLPMHKIKASDIEKWQVSELESGLKPSTVNRNLTALRGAITKAYDQGVTEINILSKVKNLKEIDDNRVRFLSDTEYSQLMDSIKKRNSSLTQSRMNSNSWRLERGYALLPAFNQGEFIDHIEPMILIAIHTGIRRGELFKLEWHDINFPRKEMTIRAANSKSSKVRRIPLNQTVNDVLIKWQKQSNKTRGYVFESEKGNHFTNIKTAWTNLIKSSGIIDFRFHDLRHHFASQLVMRGSELNTVRELLGHSDISTTLRYAHLSDDHKAEAVRLLDD